MVAALKKTYRVFEVFSLISKLLPTVCCPWKPHANLSVTSAPPLVARIHPNITERDLDQKSPNPQLKWHHETCVILTDNILLIHTLSNNLLDVTKHGKCIVMHSSNKLRVMKIAFFFFLFVFFLSNWKKKTLFRLNFKHAHIICKQWNAGWPLLRLKRSSGQ